jgi:hypothetical protein
MSKVATLAAAMFLLVFKSAPSQAQTLCTGPSNKLICVIPHLYSQAGVTIGLPNQAHQAHFDADFQRETTGLIGSLTGAFGTELTALRLATPASGIIFAFDKNLAVVKRSTDSYGPILGERAETIGRHRFFVAGSYQFFPFSTLDGIDLKRLPAVYKHADTTNPNGTHRGPNDPSSPGDPGSELEYIASTTRIDLRVHQLTLYATYGLTNRIDLSIAVPILNVRLGISSNATIVRTPDPIQQGPPLKAAWQASPSTFPGDLYPSTGPQAGCQTTVTGCTGYFHFFDPSNPATSLTATFSNARTATGLGDIFFRAKGTLFQGEHAALAVGADLRVPSGDENNFLGSGTLGAEPFLAASYRARIAPHADIGYDFNGNSILAGNPTTGAKGHLPDVLFYSIGADASVTRKLTLAVDLLGERLYGAAGIAQGAFVDVLGASHPDIPQINPTHRSFNMKDLAAGAKYSLHGNLLLTGNVQFKLDEGGLRAKIVPLVGISSTF